MRARFDDKVVAVVERPTAVVRVEDSIPARIFCKSYPIRLAGDESYYSIRLTGDESYYPIRLTYQ